MFNMLTLNSIRYGRFLKSTHTRCTYFVKTIFLMQHGNHIQFFSCFLSICQFSCHYRGEICSHLNVSLCVSVCVPAKVDSLTGCSILSDSKLRIRCTQWKHRNTEAQAEVKPINNQIFVFVWCMVARRCCWCFCYQATMRAEYCNLTLSTLSWSSLWQPWTTEVFL